VAWRMDPEDDDDSTCQRFGRLQKAAGTRPLPARGRPKTKPSFRAALLDELAATMPATDKQRAISKLQALVTALVNSAVAGNPRAQALLVGALLRMGEPEESGPDSLTSNDQAILEAYLGGELKRRADESDTAPDPGEEDAH
jgi:Family of unknown function (DUF5681)